jgi:hypothetical protein
LFRLGLAKFLFLQVPTKRNLKFQNGFRKKKRKEKEKEKEKKTRTLFFVYMKQCKL